MIPLRLARELTFQLKQAGEDERLARVLAEIPVFLVLYKGEDTSTVLSHWKQLSQEKIVPEKYYRASLEALRKSGSTLLLDALQRSTGLFESRGSWDIVVEFQSELLALADERNDRKHVMDACNWLGIISFRRGEYDRAMTQLTRALSLAESLHDNRALTVTIRMIGNVHLAQGHYTEALEHYERQLRISESFGDKSEILSAFGGLGNLHREQGRYAEAMTCQQQCLAIAESLSDKNAIARALGNMANVFASQNRLSEAMEYNERSLEIFESLGNRNSMGISIGNIGSVHAFLGQYTAAMACFERQAVISESVGNRSSNLLAIGDMGHIHEVLGQYEQALKSHRYALEGHRSINFLHPVPDWLFGIASSLFRLATEVKERPPYLAEFVPEHNDSDWRAAALRVAREYVDECLQISEQISKPETLFFGHVLLARIDAAEENDVIATEKFEAMLGESTEDEQIAELHYWLWKINHNEHHHSEALKRYTALLEHIPKFNFRKRIAELRGERIPISAD